MLLKDKVVIVSGIGPGLGNRLAVLAAKEGAAAIVLAARSAEKLTTAESEIRAFNNNVKLLSIPTDITDVARCKNLVDETIDHYGRVDILMNSAYYGGKMEPIETADLNDWRLTCETNLIGTMQLTQAVIPHMKSQGGGAIVMINTMVTHKPMPYNGGYGASKAALSSAASHLALELGQYGIRVNSAFMGWMWGPNVRTYVENVAAERGVSADQVKQEIAQEMALRVIPEDGDCAKAAIFLASDFACAVTGATLDVNGGAYLPH